MANLHKELIESLKADRPAALCTILAGKGIGEKVLVLGDGNVRSTLRSGSPFLESVTARARELLAAQRSERQLFSAQGEEADVLIEVYPPSPKLLIVGAVHAAVSLVTFANVLGFRTTVVDPRSAFATPERFAHADRLVAEWPEQAIQPSDFDESTYLVALSHDPRLDNPALKMALESPCRYIGALGSRKTHSKRVGALKDMGVSDEQLARIHAPIGLDLGGKAPAEIAVAIIAQIVAVRNGQNP